MSGWTTEDERLAHFRATVPYSQNEWEDMKYEDMIAEHEARMEEAYERRLEDMGRELDPEGYAHEDMMIAHEIERGTLYG